MNLINNQSHLLFWVFAPLLLFFGVLEIGGSALDINVHDTYFVISNLHLCILISIYFGIVGLIYWWLKRRKRKLNKWLKLFHIIITIGGVLLLFPLVYYLFNSIQSSYAVNLEKYYYLNLIIFVISILVLFGQLLFLINVLLGVFKSK